MWSVDSRDARHASREQVAHIVERGMRRGAVVLFHDGGGRHPGTLQALDRALATLAARGVASIQMSELLSEADAA
jgi:peptidoglycan/xylan/chitin deacetylase (PgdA/CDA1 family)